MSQYSSFAAFLRAISTAERPAYNLHRHNIEDVFSSVSLPTEWIASGMTFHRTVTISCIKVKSIELCRASLDDSPALLDKNRSFWNDLAAPMSMSDERYSSHISYSSVCGKYLRRMIAALVDDKIWASHDHFFGNQSNKMLFVFAVIRCLNRQYFQHVVSVEPATGCVVVLFCQRARNYCRYDTIIDDA